MTAKPIINKKVVDRAGYVVWFFERVIEPHHKVFRMSLAFTPHDYKFNRQYVLERLLHTRKLLRESVRIAALDERKEWQ